MDCYFCIVSMAAESVADLCVLDARNDEDALRKAQRIALDWPATATLSLYRGERLVDTLNGAFRAAA